MKTLFFIIVLFLVVIVSCDDPYEEVLLKEVSIEESITNTDTIVNPELTAERAF